MEIKTPFITALISQLSMRKLLRMHLQITKLLKIMKLLKVMKLLKITKLLKMTKLLLPIITPTQKIITLIMKPT